MASDIPRRTFLSTAGAAAAAVAVTGRAQAASSGDKVVLGVMGLSRGRALALGFAKLQNVEIKYVCDVDSTRAEAGAAAVEKLGVKAPQPTGDFREILDDPEVHGLVCAAPNHWHAPATILGCSAGKHVYVEKPCSHNPWEGETMVAAARKYNRAVQMGSQRRSSAGTQEAMALLHAGEIGRVYEARCHYDSLRGPTGTVEAAEIPDYLDYDLWQGPAPRMPYATNRVPYKWHWFWHWGNGELGNNGVHTLDLGRWGLGGEFPIRVTSAGGRYRFEDDQQTPDAHTVCFEFPDRKMLTWQGHSCNRGQGEFVRFYGEKGQLALGSSGDWRIFDDRGQEVKKGGGGSRGDSEHLINFVTAIREDTPRALNAEIEIGHRSTLLCHLGNIAHRTGRTLTCSAKDGHIVGDEKAMKLWKRDYEPGWEPKI
ncbi:MAG: Gfo/Idh/MocA family oxidoreductase [Planctomycetaceae bacterium]|nr:Gfo/Idh/MocA family oxidoreductase [Planctomycetaceae bacterium]